MPTPKKTETVASLQEAFDGCNIGIFTDYRGLTTTEMGELRRKLAGAEIKYRVVKNSLAQIALRQAGRAELADSINGPTAVAFGYGEIPAAAKALTEYITATKSVLQIKGGFFSDTILTAKDVSALADLPPREVLIARVIGGMQAPIYGLVSVLAGPIRNIMGVLQAQITQLEGE